MSKDPRGEIVRWRRKEKLSGVLWEWKRVMKCPCFSSSPHSPRKECVPSCLWTACVYWHSAPISGAQNWESGFGRIPLSCVLLCLSSSVWAYEAPGHQCEEAYITIYVTLFLIHIPDVPGKVIALQMCPIGKSPFLLAQWFCDPQHPHRIISCTSKYNQGLFYDH